MQLKKAFYRVSFLLSLCLLFGLLNGVVQVVDTQEPTKATKAKIAFQSNRDGNDEIYVMDADGKNQINLTNHPKNDVWPSWSPDGRKIAFTSSRDGNWEIYVMDADGRNQINLTNNPAQDRWPSWFDFVFSVSSAGKFSTTWGQVKQAF